MNFMHRITKSSRLRLYDTKGLMIRKEAIVKRELSYCLRLINWLWSVSNKPVEGMCDRNALKLWDLHLHPYRISREHV